MKSRYASSARVRAGWFVGKKNEARADVLISEILSSDLLAEDALNTFEDADARLLRPERQVIPRAATAVGCLVENDVLSQYAFVGEVAGFDVSALSALSAQRLPVHGTMTSWRRLSRDVDLLRIDLTSAKHGAEMRKLPPGAAGRHRSRHRPVDEP